GEVESLPDFIWRLEQTCEAVGLKDQKEMMKWALAYVPHDIRSEWLAIPESKGDWDDFKKKLNEEYPELVERETGSVGALRTLCSRFRSISIADEGRLLSFRHKFQVIAEKCLQAPALMSNRELVEAFVSSLDPYFRDQLNTRLSLSGTLRNVGMNVQ